MTDINYELLKFINKNDILINEQMSKHTSFKVGGIADYFVTIRDIDILKRLQKLTRKRKYTIFYYWKWK